ncbi:MAG: DUF4397 domain-containing protein [Chloroflexota bacterium]
MRTLIRGLAAAAIAGSLIVGATATVAAAERHAASVPDYAMVRVLDAMVGAGPLDVYVSRVAEGTPPTYADIAFGAATGYEKLYFTPDCTGKSTCNLEFEVAEHGKDTPFKSSMVALAGGTHATVVLASTASTGPIFDEYADSTRATAKSSLRFVNVTSTTVTPIDVSAIAMTGTGTVTATDLGFAQATRAQSTKPGDWNIQFRATGSMGMALPWTNAVLKKGYHYTAYFIGELGGVGEAAARFVLLPNR